MGLKVYSMEEMAAQSKTPEYLFWVGCAGSFDARAQKITKALCQILDHAGVSFAILGKEESCSGDPARRAGNEFVFQMLALQNIETIKMYEVQKIVTACPHCFNTLKNEYPELGEISYEVIHHTQLIAELLKEGKITLDETKMKGKKIAYHDSCYLGRVNGEYEAPRTLLNELQVAIQEPERNRTRGLCCGAGGAQMFKEDEPGDKRINIERIEELLSDKPDAIAANCPFCITMLSDGLKAKEQQDKVMVYDLSELIVDSLA